jgi:RNA polymerase sigma-70 factor (ECF subfamily)
MNEELERAIARHLDAGELAAAATEALQALGPQILGYLVATLRDEDAAHEVFGHFSEQLWKSIATFRGESSFKTWTYKLVMHSVGRYRRDGFRRRSRALQSSEVSEIAEQVRSRTAPYLQTAVKDRVSRLREALAPEEQMLLFFRVDQGMPWQDVAAVLAEAGNTVDIATLRKRFERAKARLRQLAVDQGLIEP